MKIHGKIIIIIIDLEKLQHERVGWLGVGIRQLEESDPQYIHTIKLIHANNPLNNFHRSIH
jgi:hypothetical protein